MLHPPRLRMRAALAMALACSLPLAAVFSHANSPAAGDAQHAGHSMPAATKSTPTAAAAPSAAPSSATTTYRRFTFDEPLANWREVNDSVRTIGGWRAYLKEVQDAQAQEKTTPVAGSAESRTGNKPDKEKP